MLLSTGVRCAEFLFSDVVPPRFGIIQPGLARAVLAVLEDPKVDPKQTKTSMNIYEEDLIIQKYPKHLSRIKNIVTFFSCSHVFFTSILNFFVHQCSAAGESPLGPWGELCPKMWPNVPWWISPWSNRNVNPGLIHPKRLFSWEATIKKKYQMKWLLEEYSPN